MNNKLSAQNLTEGAIMAALSAALMLASTFIPVLGGFIRMVVAVPITVLTVKRGVSTGALGATAAALIVLLILGPVYGIVFVIQFMVMALVFGWLIKKRKGAGHTLVIGAMVTVVTTAAMTGISYLATGLSLNDMMATIQAMPDEMIAMYKDMGMLNAALTQSGMTEAQFRASLASMTNIMIMLMPAMFVMMGAFTAVVHYIVSAAVLRRMKIKIRKLPPFAKWHLPPKAVWGLIIAWALWLLSDYVQIKWVTLLAQNIMIIYLVLLFVTGLAVVAHWTNFKAQSTFLKVMTVFMFLFFFTGVLLVSILVGMFDLVFDFRKLKNQPKGQPKKKRPPKPES